MSFVSVTLLFLLNAILMGKFGLVLGQNTCHLNSDCRGNIFSKVCCRGYYFSTTKSCYSGSSCYGHYCLANGDCSGIDCCRNNKCVTNHCTRCSSNSDCSGSKYCCERGDFLNVCRESCVGEICFADSDCGGPGERCYSNKCKKSSKTLSWFVPVIVVGAVLFVILLGGIPAYRCFRGSSRRGRVVRQQPPQSAIAIVAVDKAEVCTNSPPPSVYNDPPPPYYNEAGDFPSPQPKQFSPPQPLQLSEPRAPRY